MRKIRHPLSGSLYELDEDGSVLVTKNGATGRFTANGQWVSGAVRTADPEMCRWVGNPLLAGAGLASRRYTAPSAHGTPGDES